MKNALPLSYTRILLERVIGFEPMSFFGWRSRFDIVSTTILNFRDRFSLNAKRLAIAFPSYQFRHSRISNTWRVRIVGTGSQHVFDWKLAMCCWCGKKDSNLQRHLDETDSIRLSTFTSEPDHSEVLRRDCRQCHKRRLPLSNWLPRALP